MKSKKIDVIQIKELEEFALENYVESPESEDHTDEKQIPELLETILESTESPAELDRQIEGITIESNRLNKMYLGALRWLLNSKLKIKIHPSDWYSLKNRDISDLWEVFKTGKTIERGIRLVSQAIEIKYPNIRHMDEDDEYSSTGYNTVGNLIDDGARLIRSGRPYCKNCKDYKNLRTDL